MRKKDELKSELGELEGRLERERGDQWRRRKTRQAVWREIQTGFGLRCGCHDIPLKCRAIACGTNIFKQSDA
jgi:hypothetical protein